MDKKSGSWFTRFKRKNENLALILVGLFIISLIVFIVTIASNHPWMPFKFNPEEFGTVSDWVMVIVTLVTAVFLYQTLRSQMTVQRDQNRISKIEELKYIREIRPTISFIQSHRKIWKNLVNDHIDNKLLAIDLTVTITTDKTCRLSYHVFTKTKSYKNSLPRLYNVSENSTNSISFSLRLDVKEYNDNKPDIENLMFKVKYYDSDGNEYLRTYEMSFSYIGGAEYVLLNIVNNDDEIVKLVL